MEFDTNISLRPCGSVEIESSKDCEALLSEVWDVLSSVSKNVGEGTGGEFWVDFSDAVKTKYIVCNVTEVLPSDGETGSPGDGEVPSGNAVPLPGGGSASSEGTAAPLPVRRYSISLRCGRKSGRLGDAFMMVFALGVFWFFSKVVVPDPLPSNFVALGTCLVLLGATFLHIRTPFGSKESAALLSRLKALG